MSLYYDGYTQAKNAVLEMTEEELLSYIDGLWGRENLPENYSPEDLLYEVLEQCKKDFTDTSSKGFEIVDFYTKLNKAIKKDRWW